MEVPVAVETAHGPSPYLLGAPISLADLLALPPDGLRYGRDREGRLIVTPPDDAQCHRTPIGRTAMRLTLKVDPAAQDVVPEAPIAFDKVYALDGTLLPASHHGPKAVVPDLACFARPVRFVKAPRGHTWYSPSGLRLVIEFLSPSTFETDLGARSETEDVDRWRTYLEGGVPEYWVINAGFPGCPLPPRSGLFLSFDASHGTWSELPVEAARFAEPSYRGIRPVTSGKVRSIALAGVTFDLDELWRDCAG